MGWAKYHEDIVDAITDSGFYDRVSNYVTKSIEPPIFNCSYCNLSFYSKNDLYEHIKREHNIVSSILVVNGKIVHNECYVKELKSFIVIRYDLNDSIFVNQKQILEYATLNEVDIVDRVYQDFLTNKTVSISVGEKEFNIHLISQEHINVDKINSIISKWSIETSKGLHIQKNISSLNEIEKRCLDGLYNYFIACVSTGKNKDLRYNDAYAILSEVANILPVATVLLKIIALKFNWIEKLRVLCIEDDIFSDIYDFMTKNQSTRSRSETGSLQIFIEDELEEIIKTIIAYQENKYDDVEIFVKRYPIRSIANIADYNQRDKICLLCARMAIRRLSKHEARRYYDEIQSPFFDDEKMNYIKTM